MSKQPHPFGSGFESHEQWAESMGYPPEYLPLIRACRDVVMQHHGKTNAWAGMWVICPQCDTHYAYGGNWNDIDPTFKPEPEVCPACRLRSVLTAGGKVWI